MQISVEEFAKEPERYINLAQNHEIGIARDGKKVALLSSSETPRQKAVKKLLKMKGILPPDINLEKIREERFTLCPHSENKD